MASAADGDLARELIALERELLDPPVRVGRTRVETLLHPEFVEIGVSGTWWNRQAILDALQQEDPNGVAPQTMDFAVRHLTPGLVQVTYESRTSTGRRAARSSLWAETDQGYRMVFHQGTTIP